MWRFLKALIALPFVLLLSFNAYVLGSIEYWRTFPPNSTSFMNQRMALLKASQPELALKYEWVPYSNLSNHLKRALIASEDAKFTSHEGLDWQGIQHALKKNQKKGKISAGGSTITQQLAKNLFLWEERSYIRKAEETAITFMLEGNVDKTRIFEIYINVIEWGNGVYGAEAASEHYYKKPAKSLTPSEAARLAAMITNPRYYEEHLNDKNLRRKTNIILKRMGHATIPEPAQDSSGLTGKKPIKK